MKKKIVYVLTAPYYKTGGTELCHQLVSTINDLGGTAKVLYKKADDEKYVNPAFEKYVKDYEVLTEKKYEEIDGIVVIPESETLEIPKFKKATVYLWWMSVDNYYRYQNLKLVYEEKKLLRTIKYFFTGYKFKKKYLTLDKMTNVKLHLAQSEYAIDFLEKNGFSNIAYLSDFINDGYIESAPNYLNKPKNNIVLYNPNKGYLFTKKIIERNKNIQFIPLENMSNEELMKCIGNAKVYIDFGNHPGKDRLPRETAILGCCVITGKRGSAAYDDVMIPSKYKFDDKNRCINDISKAIRDLLENYELKNKDYELYRDKILNEKNVFINDVKKIFWEESYEEK